MGSSIVIAYATRSGSTAEVAESIDATLREFGLWAELAPVSRVESLQGTTALILGAPLYMGAFPKDFHKFAVRHRSWFENRRPWCFVLGPTRTDTVDFEAAQEQAAKQLTRYSWIKPAEVKVFGGRWDSELLPFPFSLLRRLPLNPMKKIAGSDVRDWDAIREWAKAIAHQIKSAA